MKKVLSVVAAVLVVIVLICGVLVVAVLNSPHYALRQIAEDVQREGIEGLEKHLTDDAQETLDKIDSKLDDLTAVPDKGLMGLIFSVVDVESYVRDYIETLKEKFEEIEWTLGDVLTNFKKAVVYLEFNYDDEIIGTVDLKMIRGEDGWKIDGIGMPEFEQFEW